MHFTGGSEMRLFFTLAVVCGINGPLLASASTISEHKSPSLAQTACAHEVQRYDCLLQEIDSAKDGAEPVVGLDMDALFDAAYGLTQARDQTEIGLTHIPLPSSVVLMLTALALLMRWRKRAERSYRRVEATA